MLSTNHSDRKRETYNWEYIKQKEMERILNVRKETAEHDIK